MTLQELRQYFEKYKQAGGVTPHFISIVGRKFFEEIPHRKDVVTTPITLTLQAPESATTFSGRNAHCVLQQNGNANIITFNDVFSYQKSEYYTTYTIDELGIIIDNLRLQSGQTIDAMQFPISMQVSGRSHFLNLLIYKDGDVTHFKVIDSTNNAIGITSTGVLARGFAWVGESPTLNSTVESVLNARIKHITQLFGTTNSKILKDDVHLSDVQPSFTLKGSSDKMCGLYTIAGQLAIMDYFLDGEHRKSTKSKVMAERIIDAHNRVKATSIQTDIITPEQLSGTHALFSVITDTRFLSSSHRIVELSPIAESIVSLRKEMSMIREEKKAVSSDTDTSSSRIKEEQKAVSSDTDINSFLDDAFMIDEESVPPEYVYAEKCLLAKMGLDSDPHFTIDRIYSFEDEDQEEYQFHLFPNKNFLVHTNSEAEDFIRINNLHGVNIVSKGPWARHLEKRDDTYGIVKADGKFLPLEGEFISYGAEGEGVFIPTNLPLDIRDIISAKDTAVSDVRSDDSGISLDSDNVTASGLRTSVCLLRKTRSGDNGDSSMDSEELDPRGPSRGVSRKPSV